MKSSRFLSAALTVTLVAAGTLLIASPASASTTVGINTFYDATDFGQETSAGYPASGDWFFGQVSGTEGPHAFTRNGLEMNADGSGDVQILNQNVGAQPADAAELVDTVSSFEVEDGGPGTWSKQLAFFAEGDTSTEFTTLRPSASGGAPHADWTTSQAFGTYAAGDTASLEDFADALFVGEAPTLLAYGIFVGASASSTILSISWDGLTSFFAPVPTRTASPSPITTVEFSTPGQGLTLSGTNWLPNSHVLVHIEDSNGNWVFDDSFSASATGDVSVNVVLPSLPEAGVYFVTFDDDGVYFFSGQGESSDGAVFGDPFMELTVTEPAAAPAEILPVTGADFSPMALTGALALLLGGALLVHARRRDQTVNNG